MPRFFAPTPFRWTDNVDYPYGWQDIPDDSKARAMKAAGKVSDGVFDAQDDLPLVSPLISSVSTSLKRVNPVRVATIGDSTADVNGTAHDISLFTAASGSIGPEKYQLSSLYPQAYLVGNGGIGGQTTTQILARDATATSTTRKAIQDIINLRPDVVLLRGGSINNISGAISATAAALIATAYAEHCQIINKFLSAGIPVLDSGIYGYSGSGTEPATVRAALMTLEGMFDSYAAQFPGRVFRPSWTGILRDSTGAYLPNVVLADGQGVHLSFFGQYLASQWEASVLTQLFGASSGPRYRGQNLLKNAATTANGGNNQFASTTTSGIGTFPTGMSWGTYGAGGTRQNGKVEVIDGRLWATMEFVPVATGGLTCYLPLDAANWTTAANDIWAVEFDLFFKPLSGSSVPISNTLVQWDWNDGSGRTITALQNSQAFTWPDATGWSGRVVLQPTVLNAANTSPEIFTRIVVTDTTPIKAGISAPRLVKLGTTSTWPPAPA